MKQLQNEHALWISKKYPGQQPKIPAVGCLEEAGELVHCVLKTEQVQTWGEDSRHKLTDLKLKLIDAIGDCGIYACSLCNASGWNFYEVWQSVDPRAGDDTLRESIRLCSVAANIALFPHVKVYLQEYVQQLKTVARCLDLDVEKCVLRTWQIVKER